MTGVVWWDVDRLRVTCTEHGWSGEPIAGSDVCGVRCGSDWWDGCQVRFAVGDYTAPAVVAPPGTWEWGASVLWLVMFVIAAVFVARDLRTERRESDGRTTRVAGDGCGLAGVAAPPGADDR